jgi:hypothetical protein
VERGGDEAGYLIAGNPLSDQLFDIQGGGDRRERIRKFPPLLQQDPAFHIGKPGEFLGKPEQTKRRAGTTSGMRDQKHLEVAAFPGSAARILLQEPPGQFLESIDRDLEREKASEEGRRRIVLPSDARVDLSGDLVERLTDGHTDARRAGHLDESGGQVPAAPPDRTLPEKPGPDVARPLNEKPAEAALGFLPSVAERGIFLAENGILMEQSFEVLPALLELTFSGLAKLPLFLHVRLPSVREAEWVFSVAVGS